MNYRHAFHAGNFADIAKHLALVAALGHLRKKDSAFCVIDTHAGRGAYDLSDQCAGRTGEAAAGILRLIDPPLPVAASIPAALATYLGFAAADAYPGSPLIAAKLIRPQDRLVAIEKHPEDAAALALALRPFARARVEAGDGYARLAALLPPPERRGLVLIDPPYESPDEFRDAARAFAGAFRRFATGLYLIWFPIKSAAEANGFCGEVLASGAAKVLRLDIEKRDAGDGKLASAGLLVVNPPWKFEDEMHAAFAPILPRLNCAIRFDWLAGEA